ncbi:MAG: hypothetical protein ACOX44_12205 [Limnochordia bacterium]|jgi:adenylosuccinate lyase
MQREILVNLSPLHHRYYRSDPESAQGLSKYPSEDAQITSEPEVEAAPERVSAKRGPCSTKAVDQVEEKPRRITPQEAHLEEENARRNIRALANCLFKYADDDVKPVIPLAATSKDILDTLKMRRACDQQAVAGVVGDYNADSLIYPDPEAFDTEIPADEPQRLQRAARWENTFPKELTDSSTMPHKRNPWNFAHTKSLWKVFTPRIPTMYMDRSSEHQRDIITSASQRFLEIVAPLALASKRLAEVLNTLAVDKERMQRTIRQSSRTGKETIAGACSCISEVGAVH